MDNKRLLKIRLIIAAIVGMIIMGICLYLTWGIGGSSVRLPQFFTGRILEKTDTAIAKYYQQNGILPRSLNQLSAVPIQDNGTILDWWKHPLVYEVHQNNYTLMSYGRDGKPGGVGLDCDLSSVNPKPAAATLPFLQVILDPSTQWMVLSSILSGIFAFLITFDVVTPINLAHRRWGELIFKILFTIIATCVVAVFITMLHVPSGH